MDNAERRNIHAPAACGKAGMDRRIPSPDTDDGAGRSKIVRPSRCETPRPVLPQLSRLAMQHPEFPHYASPDPSPRRRRELRLVFRSRSGRAPSLRTPTRDRTVRRCRGSRVPNLGESREETVLHVRRRAAMSPGGGVERADLLPVFRSTVVPRARRLRRADPANRRGPVHASCALLRLRDDRARRGPDQRPRLYRIRCR